MIIGAASLAMGLILAATIKFTTIDGAIAAADIAGLPTIVLLVIGEVIWSYGCWFYAKTKGYSGVVGLLGAILGLSPVLGLVTLLILFLLPSKLQETEEDTPLQQPTGVIS